MQCLWLVYVGSDHSSGQGTPTPSRTPGIIPDWYVYGIVGMVQSKVFFIIMVGWFVV